MGEVAKAKRMDDAKTEIEKRREAMLAREKAALQAGPVDSDADDAEARRRAAEEKAKAAAADARLRRKVASDGADETETKVENMHSIKAEALATDEDACSAPKRPRVEEAKTTETVSATPAKTEPATAGTAMQQGL